MEEDKDPIQIFKTISEIAGGRNEKAPATPGWYYFLSNLASLSSKIKNGDMFKNAFLVSRNQHFKYNFCKLRNISHFGKSSMATEFMLSPTLSHYCSLHT